MPNCTNLVITRQSLESARQRQADQETSNEGLQISELVSGHLELRSSDKRVLRIKATTDNSCRSSIILTETSAPYRITKGTVLL